MPKTLNVAPSLTPTMASAHGAETKALVWILTPDPNLPKPLAKSLRNLGMDAQSFSLGRDLLGQERPGNLSAIIADMQISDIALHELLDRLRSRHPGTPIILITPSPDLESAVSAYREGAFEYLPKPFDLNDACAVILRACQQAARDEDTDLSGVNPAGEIIGSAPVMHDVFRTIARLARSQTPVLIQGESGTGKELVARAVHRHSPRSSQPFIGINIAALPPELMEAELFGQEPVAHGHAQGRRAGRFEQANGGTLFLDEIGDLPLALQGRLLRVLADGEFFPVGAVSPVKVDVRLITSTRHHLETLVTVGRFRDDLYHRLNAVHIQLPSLRERRQDIPLLVRHFLNEASRELRVEAKSLAPGVESFLHGLDWPGNVRQLENACRWITAMAVGRNVTLEDLPPDLLQSHDPERFTDAMADQWPSLFRHWARQRIRNQEPNIAREVVDLAEGILIETALELTQGRREEAAKLLGYGRNTVSRKITELNLKTDSQAMANLQTS